jgi:hypothetical protein
MNNFFEDLKKYFETTPREQVLNDWAKSVEFDKIGPTVEEFLKKTQEYYHIYSEEPLNVPTAGLNEYSSNYSSSFFYV